MPSCRHLFCQQPIPSAKLEGLLAGSVIEKVEKRRWPKPTVVFYSRAPPPSTLTECRHVYGRDDLLDFQAGISSIRCNFRAGAKRRRGSDSQLYDVSFGI